MKTITMLLFFLFSFIIKADIYKEFLQTYNLTQKQDQIDDKKAFEEYKIVFIHGLLTDTFPQIMSYIRSLGFKLADELMVSFHDQQTYFKDARIDSEKLYVSTQETVEINRDVIKDYIENSSKEIIFITHSKGAIDLLDSLVTYEHLREKVAGWISLQAPFWGSPLVTLFNSTPPLNMAIKFLMKIFEGKSKSLYCMMPHLRIKYNQDHKEEILSLSKYFPIINVGSYEKGYYFTNLFRFLRGKLSFFNSTILYINKHRLGGKNDGFVPLYSTCLYPSNCLSLPGMDHGSFNLDMPFFKTTGSYERIVITRTLLYMITNRIKNNL